MVMFIMILLLIVLDALAGSKNDYLGLVTYIALPAVMLFGLVVALVGAIRQQRRIRKGQADHSLPVINLNLPKHRFVLTSFAIGGLVLMAMSGFGSYKAYEYTESVQFCGTTCHQVMRPEYTAYQHSPHAHVTCTGCHVGSGATWYVRSKLSGAYQLYSVAFNKYSRPIKSPIHNLRPAKETCEECHWPKFFFNRKLVNHTYYLSDEENSRYDLTMLVKIGGGKPGSVEGIHSHMYLDRQVSYISTDRQRQVIPYVEMRDSAGNVTIYRDQASKATDADLAKGERRTIDCIDCHNRPTHIYQHPEFAVNRAMEQGTIDEKLPEIKSAAVEALEKEGYKTEAEALTGLDKQIREFYAKNHANADQKSIGNAISAIQDIYKGNYFPDMNVSWKAYPNNLDHLHSAGCFRCHDGKHVSDKGKVISRDCQTCHVFVSQKGPGKPATVKMDGQEFRHPVDVGDEWKTSLCMDCHGKDKDK